MKCRILFTRKNKENSVNLSSAAFNQESDKVAVARQQFQIFFS